MVKQLETRFKRIETKYVDQKNKSENIVDISKMVNMEIEYED